MKVLIILFAEYPGGSAPANHVQRFSRALRLNGVGVSVLAYARPGYAGDRNGVDAHGIPFELLSVRDRWFGMPPYVPLAFSFRHAVTSRLEEILSDGTWDAVIYNGRSWLVGRSILEIAHRNHVVVAPFQVEWFPATVQRIVNGSQIDQVLFRRWVLPGADGIIGITYLWEDWSRDRGLPSVVIPALAEIDPARGCPTRVRTDPAFTLVFVGGWNSRELPKTLCQGLDAAIKRGIKLRLIVVGRTGGRRKGGGAAANLLAKFPSLCQNTSFAGWVSDAVLKEHLNASDVFVILRSESRETRALFPTRLPEYLATGNPVIASAAGDVPRYLKHRESAWLIPAGDSPDELAEAIVYLAGHETERQAIGRAGWAVAAREMSLAPLGMRLRRFLERIVSERASKKITA